MANSLLKARIIRSNYSMYIAEYNQSTYQLQVSGRFQYMAYQKTDYPVVGDYVLFHETNPSEGIIEQVLERKNALTRKATSTTFDAQILASNIDIVFICMALDGDFNLTKLKKFLALSYDDSLTARILLTKADLCDDIDEKMNQVRILTTSEIDVISSFQPGSIQQIRTIIGEQTCVLVGSSGVGKSTLINALIGEDYLETNTVRLSDAQGRHTTTHRELVHLPGGGAIIDTPGIRIIDFYQSDNIDSGFEDISTLAVDCRYRDCTHKEEPGCKVQEAIIDGDLDYDRLVAYNKLLKVQAFHKQQERIKQQKFEKRNKRQ